MTNRLKMKDLERATGVGREAIRFYIREGLLPEPERTGRNVAWYDESFIERIALIKRLQTERFLPLAIIKAILRGDEPPPQEHAQTLAQIEKGLSTRSRSQQTRLPERLDRISARTGLAIEDIRELAEIGTIEVVRRDGGEWIEGLSIPVVEAWGEMRRAGLTAERGFSMDVTGTYVQMVQWLAREEIRMFTERATGKVSGEELTRMAEVGIEAAGRMLVAMRERVIRRFIAEGNVPRAAEPPAPLRAEGKRRGR
ncbi:MAG TPA: MerR family transcriptional regulator [Candidatus Limnocylindrales bacterium]|nr:MerR family transcriptional regulator [Candidatus Limnocylindrales bacterium]